MSKKKPKLPSALTHFSRVIGGILLSDEEAENAMLVAAVYLVAEDDRYVDLSVRLRMDLEPDVLEAIVESVEEACERAQEENLGEEWDA